MKKKIVFLFIFLLFKAAVYAYEIDLNADNLEYDQNCGKISAYGNVIITWQGKKVKADFVEFLVDEKIMTASGGVKIEEDGNSFFADNISYHFEGESGEINQTFTSAASAVFMRSESMLRQGKDIYAVNNIKISNCDLDHPHTYFKAKRGKITLGKRVTIYNPIFYIGKVPIFYLPIVTKSLEGGRGFSSRLKYKIEPGYTNNGGLSVMNSFEYRFNQQALLKASLDYFGTRGFGYGGEFDYFTQNARASVFAYNIKDLSYGMDRWTVRPFYWHRLNDKWTIQSQAELISDSTFNNYYNQNDWNRTMNTLHSYAALTRQGQRANLMIVTERYDNYDSYKGEFETTSITLPQINFTYYPKKIFWGITNSFNLIYNNNYREWQYGSDNFFYRNTASFNYTLAKDYKLGRRFTLKPTLGISEEWSDKNTLGATDNTFLTRYSAGLNSRFRATGWMDWNINYSAVARTEKNSLQIDSSADDYGIESNFLTYSNYMYVGNRTIVRNFLSYNLKDDRRHVPQ
ncbi:MAG: LPS assembly protein LptD, partial [Endomicrobia bacterium]|nr:LPS assembly protein LptD [Endomicrobiia bacterium]